MSKTGMFLIGIASIIASPAFAQESEWTGAYVGIHAGYTSTQSDSDLALSGAWTTESQGLRDEVVGNWSNEQSLDDFNLGAQLGYNYDAGGVVIGAEVDFSFLGGSENDLRGPIPTTAFPSLSYTYGNRVDPKNMASLRARLGVPFGSTLAYVHGGWAWTRATVGAEIISNGGYTKEARLTDTFDGVIFGGGFEHRFGKNVSARLEYSYADQGDVSYVTEYRPGSTFTSPAYTETFSQDLNLHLVRVGINYSF